MLLHEVQSIFLCKLNILESKGGKNGEKKKQIVPLLFWLPQVVYMPLCAYTAQKTIVDKFFNVFECSPSKWCRCILLRTVTLYEKVQLARF